MRRSWLGSLFLLLAVLGCRGPTTSLDTEAGTTATETAATETAATETTATGDVPTGDEPVVCDEACTPILAPTWTYEGPAGAYMVVELLRDADGSLWLGTRHGDGGVGISKLSAAGELSWSARPGAMCERCELVDIALHPTGDVLLSVTGRGDVAPDQAVIARYDVELREVAWARTLALRPGEGMEPRVGELAVLDADRIVVLRVDGWEEGEVLELLDLTADGTLRGQGYLGTQAGTGGPWPPLVVRAPTGEAVLSYAWWDDETEQLVAATSRSLPPSYVTVSRLLLPLPLDDLAVDAMGRRLELARSEGTDSVTLLVTSRRSSDPERWSATLPLLSTSSTRAALAVGPDDSVYAIARTTPRAPPGMPYEVRLELARWSSDGRLRWQAMRPLPIMATPDPLELVVDDDHGVIVGTVVEGRPTVVRYEQACACE